MSASYTALIGVLVAWAGVVWYLVRLDRRIRRLRERP